MKVKLSFLLLFCFNAVYSQTPNFDSLLNKGKAEFKKEFEAQDYKQAVEYLDQCVAFEPENAEARYFLAYAYGRLNSKHGENIPDMSLELTVKCSEQLDIVNQLSPKYTGERIVLDPYSKISSEWASLAMSYLYHNQTDSAKWACLEGKRWGGFNNYIVELNKKILDNCSDSAILFVSGDNMTMPIFYLQIAEGYRTDVAVVDLGLLNTTWYPKFLIKRGIVSFNLSANGIDSLRQQAKYGYFHAWESTKITINNFSWVVKPLYSEQFLSQANMLLLSILQKNEFKHDVYFTMGAYKDDLLNIDDYLVSQILVSKINTKAERELSDAKFEKLLTDILQLTTLIDTNRIDELEMLGMLRYAALNRATTYIENKMPKKAKKLLNILNKYANYKKYPPASESEKMAVKYIRQQIN